MNWLEILPLRLPDLARNLRGWIDRAWVRISVDLAVCEFTMLGFVIGLSPRNRTDYGGSSCPLRGKL